VIDLEYYASVGLYDPTSGHAYQVEQLLDWFERLGWSSGEIAATTTAAEIAELTSGMGGRGEPKFTMAQAAATLGIDVDEFDQLRRTVGLVARDMVGPTLTGVEVDAFGTLESSKDLFTLGAIEHFSRVLGSSLARIADAARSLFVIDVERPLIDGGATPSQVVQENFRAWHALDGLTLAMGPLLHLHMEDAVQRDNDARRRDLDINLSRLAIGFVDLVGFTAFSEKVSAAELALLVRRFEDAAYDIVVDNGGRLVKLIGDEVMFVSVDAEAACRIARTLVNEFRDERVTPRGGLAYGDLLSRGGDYYGPIVNLAARIADLATPCEILATTQFADLCNDAEFQPAGRRQLKGIETPVDLVSIFC
jgi:class 3 adenylate cyclase